MGQTRFGRMPGTGRTGPLVALALAAGLLSGCAFLSPMPEPASVDDRLAMFPRDDLPLEHPVRIYWNDHAVPFIEADSDRDAAMALGMVHAHLRLGQMEILRRISQGRLAEVAGPLAVDIDKSLRILGFGRAAPEIVAAMPPETLEWVQGYLDGVNHYQARVERLPHEFDLMGRAPEPWTAEDLVTIGRLASSDVNWFVWFRLLEQRQRSDWAELWPRLVEQGSSSLPSFMVPDQSGAAPLEDLLLGSGKTGSNVLVVAGQHTQSGAAMIASDPHLGLLLPNTWLLVGLKSPSFHMVGMMVPGLPFVAVGRNPDIAWSGTNLRSANSDLFDVSGLTADEMPVRAEPLAVRWWFDTEVEIRETAFGPVISDAPMVPAGEDDVLALRWIGHDVSDELTAMLRMNRATDWPEFEAAMAGFAISAQNMLYADRAGRIGQVMATHLPARSLTPPTDLVQQPEAIAAWDRIVTSRELPQVVDPASGYIGSANNRGTEAEIPIGWFFSDNDRIQRLQQFMEEHLAGDDPVTIADMMALQADVYMISSAELNAALVTMLEETGIAASASGAEALVFQAMAAWDGHYREDAPGPVAFEAFLANFLDAYYTPEDRAAYEGSGRVQVLVLGDVEAASPEALAPALQTALAGAAPAVEAYPTWGEMHRLFLRHPLAMVPILGERYRIANLPVGGSTGTLMKTAHAITDERHDTRYGANARQVTDMGDPDANWFVLLGGQDGWLNSENFADQVELWRDQRYIQMPLRIEAVRAAFPRRMELVPDWTVHSRIPDIAGSS